MVKTGEKYSEERLLSMRRLRRARYLAKKTPLFAFLTMQSEYQGYSYEQYVDDLRRRSKPKKKKGRSPLVRYGRYREMEKALANYHLTRELQYAVIANQLRKRMTKPYRVLYRNGSDSFEYTLSPLIPYQTIKALVEQLRSVREVQQADALVDRARHWTF